MSRQQLRGSIDAVHNGRCFGWAMDAGASGPIEVEVVVDGAPAGRQLANRYRPDLEQAGLRDGRLAFEVDIPAALRDGRPHRIEVRTRAGRSIATRDALQIMPNVTPAEFDRGGRGLMPTMRRSSASCSAAGRPMAWLSKWSSACGFSASMAG